MCEGIVKKSELVVWTGSSPPECCAICREVFQVGVDICRVLDCTHVFHAKCIDLWFVKASSCPLCKNDLKISGRNSSSQRSLGRSSQTSSQMSLGSVSLRSGQILVGHSNSDPALLRTLYREALLPRPQTPDRHVSSTPSLHGPHDRSMDVISMSRSEHSLALLSESSSGLLPAVQEGSEEARFEESLPMDSSNPNSARTAGQTSSSDGSRSRSRSEGQVQLAAPAEANEELEEEEEEAPQNEVDEKPMTWQVLTPEQCDPCRAPVFGQPVPQRVALPVHATAWSLTLPSSASHRKLAVGPPTSISLTMEAKVTTQTRQATTSSGAQSVQLPRHLEGAMKRSLSQAQETETGAGAAGAAAGQGQIPVDRDDRLVASTNTVMYSARPMVASPPCTLNRPSHVAPQTFRVAGQHPAVAGPHASHAGYRPMTVAFHGFQVATRSSGMAMVPHGVRWL